MIVHDRTFDSRNPYDNGQSHFPPYKVGSETRSAAGSDGSILVPTPHERRKDHGVHSPAAGQSRSADGRYARAAGSLREAASRATRQDRPGIRRDPEAHHHRNE